MTQSINTVDMQYNAGRMSESYDYEKRLSQLAPPLSYFVQYISKSNWFGIANIHNSTKQFVYVYIIIKQNITLQR